MKRADFQLLEPEARTRGVDRRRFLAYGLAGAAGVAGLPFIHAARAAAEPAEPAELAELAEPAELAELAELAEPAERARAGVLAADVRKKLDTSPLVYISPIRSDGSESRCHAEVWYAWLSDAAGSATSASGAGSLVVTVAAKGWKAQSLKRGLNRARLWVGDYGRWKGLLSNNETFRAGPSFVARAESVEDLAVLERLLAVYDKKYPAEIGKWRDSMRAGSRDGTRVVIRYTPIEVAALQ